MIAGVSVIDKQPEQEQSNAGQSNDNFREEKGKEFEKKLEPGDIKLSSAMAMSAAAMSPYLGKYENEERQATHILTVLGMEMAANTVYDLEGERKENW